MDLLTWCELNLDDGRHKGEEFAARCPWCDDSSRFSVNLEKQVYRCFRGSCGQQGWAGQLIAHVEGVGLHQARSKLGGGESLPKIPKHRQSTKERVTIDIPLPAEFIPCHKPGRVDENGEDKEWRIPRRLREREIELEILSRYGVGFCRDGDQYNRAVLPVRCAGVAAWTARDLTDDWKLKAWRSKYKNPAGSWVDSAFYGWDEAKLDGSDLVIVEGPFDVLKLAGHGINAIGLLGKALKPEQPRRKLLFEIPRGTSITVMVDPEVSGLDIDEILAMIPRRHRVYVATLPAGIDPGESTREQAIFAIDNARKIR